MKQMYAALSLEHTVFKDFIEKTLTTSLRRKLDQCSVQERDLGKRP